jgi:hypothetical protein
MNKGVGGWEKNSFCAKARRDDEYNAKSDWSVRTTRKQRRSENVTCTKARRDDEYCSTRKHTL